MLSEGENSRRFRVFAMEIDLFVLFSSMTDLMTSLYVIKFHRISSLRNYFPEFFACHEENWRSIFGIVDFTTWFWQKFPGKLADISQKFHLKTACFTTDR
jgi:hypothetical protein